MSLHVNNFFPRIFRRAWIRVLAGQPLGREYRISQRVTTLGNRRPADIILRGDSAIAPIHLAIERLPSHNRHRLRFLAASGSQAVSYAPPLVNGQPVTNEQWLTDGDRIQIGSRTLLFQEKATRRKKETLRPLTGPLEKPEVHPYIGQELADTRDFAPRPPRTHSAEVSTQRSEPPGGLGTRLVCLEGPYAGQSFHLSHAPMTIGRASDRDISLAADLSISRAHVHLVYQNGCHLIANDSSYGTLLNGKPLTEQSPLTPGDLLQLGETLLRYE